MNDITEGGDIVPLRIRRIAPRPELDHTKKAHEARGITAPDPEKDFVDIDLEEFVSLDLAGGRITLEPSNLCNLRCRYCAVPKDDPCDIDWDRIAYIFKLVKLSGMSTAVITGGEPGIFRDIRRIISDLHSWGFYVSLLTNGTWASQMDRARELVGLGLTEVHVSMKEFTKGSFLSLTGRDLFERSRQGLENISSLRRDGSLRYFHMNHVITRYSFPVRNIIDFFDAFDFCPDLFLITMVEPIKGRDYDLVPQLDMLLRELDVLLSYLDARRIPFRVEGVPLCMLGDRIAASLDRAHMSDNDYRVFVTFKEHRDSVFVFRGWQRFLQFAHGKGCDACAYLGQCPGVHKTILEYWRDDCLKPLTAGGQR